MNFKLFTIFFFPLFSLFGECTSFLQKNLQHFPCSMKGIDAVFIVCNSPFQPYTASSLQEKLTNEDIQVSLNQTYHSHFLPTGALSAYCSQNISPELLAQILNHLSLYQYALDKNLSSIVVIETPAILKEKGFTIEKLVEELQNLDWMWDLLFLNTDYCYEKGGNMQHAVPHITKNGKDMPNKRRISSSLSRVFRRYGCSSYVISERGMKKILRYFKNTWPDIPLDQAFFHGPSLRTYSANQDLLIDRVCSTKKGYFKRKNYPLGSEFSIDPIELIATSRLDIVAKYLYAKSIIENKNTDLHKQYYLEHIKAWNNFYEGAPLKIGAHAFLSSFHQLIASMQQKGYCDSAAPVPINSAGVILNGSHRVAACLALNIPVRVKVVKQIPNNYVRVSFIETMPTKHHLSEEAINSFISGYISLKSNQIYFLECFESRKELTDFISLYVDIIDHRGNTYLVDSEEDQLVEQLVKECRAKGLGTLSVSRP